MIGGGIYIQPLGAGSSYQAPIPGSGTNVIGNGIHHYPSSGKSAKTRAAEERALRQHEEELEKVNHKIALAERDREKLHKLSLLEAGQKAAQRMAALEAQAQDEIRMMFIERQRLIRLINDEEETLIVLYSLPFMH